MPETVMLELGWPLSEKAQADIDDKKRKPSKEIRIDAMRDAVEFAQRTAGRGRGKAMLVYPAERMNHITANALLKTLEEPPGDLKFVLASGSCTPTVADDSQPLFNAHVDLAARVRIFDLDDRAGRQKSRCRAPVTRRRWSPRRCAELRQFRPQPADWQSFPKAMAKGDVGAVSNWLPADLLDAQQKLCHDLMASKSGALPRFFKPADLPTATPSYTALAAWHKTLSATARTVEHPFNAGLMPPHVLPPPPPPPLEALVSDAQRVMALAKYGVIIRLKKNTLHRR